MHFLPIALSKKLTMTLSASVMKLEELFDELRSPYHCGSHPSATHIVAARNPLCGDEVTWYLCVNGEKVEAVWHEARGCAISQIAASLLCRYVEGRTKTDLMQLTPADILTLVNIPLNPVRQRCALLSLEALHQCISRPTRMPTAGGTSKLPG